MMVRARKDGFREKAPFLDLEDHGTCLHEGPGRTVCASCGVVL